MNVSEVMAYLESKGSEQTRKVFTNHGAPGNFFGVKVGDMKPIEKKEKHNHALALELYNTGNSDAQYLAGLIANPKEFTEEELAQWARDAAWYMVSEYAVAWNLAENPNCVEICVKWIESDDEKLQVVAWAALGAFLGIAPDEAIDVQLMQRLLAKVEKEIHEAPNRIRYTMNSFVIALGGAVASLSEGCKAAGDRIGKVDVYLGKTSCKVPSIRPYIEKMENMGRIGVKKKSAKC